MNVLDALFSPVGKKYCSLFYYISVVSFVMYVIVLLGTVGYGIKSGKGGNYYMVAIGASLMYLFMYFQNRILYSMCMH